jgi:hypothetical protein
MNIVALLIEMVSGLVGGNVASMPMKERDLGLLWNSVAGFVGGGAVGLLVQALIPSFGTAVRGGSYTILPILGEIASGLVGGAAVMLLVALVKYLITSRR